MKRPASQVYVCEIEYVGRSIEAQRRIRKGDRQGWCWTCERWRFTEECPHPKVAKLPKQRAVRP